jgi:hypothetical protein
MNFYVIIVARIYKTLCWFQVLKTFQKNELKKDNPKICFLKILPKTVLRAKLFWCTFSKTFPQF